MRFRRDGSTPAVAAVAPIVPRPAPHEGQWIATIRRPQSRRRCMTRPSRQHRKSGRAGPCWACSSSPQSLRQPSVVFSTSCVVAPTPRPTPGLRRRSPTTVAWKCRLPVQAHHSTRPLPPRPSLTRHCLTRQRRQPLQPATPRRTVPGPIPFSDRTPQPCLPELPPRATVSAWLGRMANRQSHRRRVRGPAPVR